MNGATFLSRRPLALFLFGLLISLMTGQAQALPSYARQTGMDCVACHVGGFGPQLTPAGIRFKLGGYLDSDGKSGKVPLSAMVIGSFNRTKAYQNPAPDHLRSNNNTTLDEASVFLAGKLTDHIGSFVQVTRDGVANNTALDQADIRYVRAFAGKDGRDNLIGLTVNNNPTVQDPFNTQAVWRFPYTSSPAGFGTGPSATLINGGLEQKVVGASLYTLLGDSIYAELGSYRSLAMSTMRKLGQDQDTQRLGGNAYYRLAYLKDFKTQAFNVGLIGWNAKVNPDRTMGVLYNDYKDVGVDGSYQFFGNRQHIVTVNGSYIRERQKDGITGDLARLKERRIDASYYYHQTVGATLGTFDTSSGTDPLAKTSGYLAQVDWTPWGSEDRVSQINALNLRLGLQYWVYNKYAGDAANARDHNTLTAFGWFAF